jgi:hypothetical protein
MSPSHEVRGDLEPGATAEIMRLAQRLQRQRPVPSVAFRGDLRRRLRAGVNVGSRPARLRLLIAGCASAGSLLLALGAASVAGIGPLGP